VARWDCKTTTTYRVVTQFIKAARDSPERLQLSSQHRSELVIDLYHDRLFVVLDVCEEMDERMIASSHCDYFHLKANWLLLKRF